jgi:hypothetical protein
MKQRKKETGKRFCWDCGHNHRLFTKPYFKCFGVPVRWTTLFDTDRVVTAFIDDANWEGEPFSQFVNGYEKYLGVGISFVRRT